MAAGAAAAPAAAPTTEQNSTSGSTHTAAPAATAGSAPALSNAEIKAKKKAEKLAQRAQAREAKAVAASAAVTPAAAAAASGSQPGSASGKSGKAKQDGQLQPSHGQGRPTAPPRRPSLAGRRPSIAAAERDARSAIPECFSHIHMAKRISPSLAHKDVHPAVLAVGQQMAAFTVRDSIARLEVMLLAFKKVIESYETPKGNSLSRHFVPHELNPQIEYLTDECRPMCFAMGNAIRILKIRINEFDIDSPEDEAKAGLLDAIDTFLAERITLAAVVIARNAANMVASGDVILTLGHHRLVERALLQAARDGKRFEVAVVDDPFDPAGAALAKTLRAEAGLRVYYSPHLAGLRMQARRATKVFLGAEAMFGNGAMYAAAGSSDIAAAAKDANKPVVALCETINFDRDRVPTDSLTYNEIDPDRASAESFRLLFDTTPAKHIDVVVTEYESETGSSPAQAILAILRQQEDPNAS